MTDATASRDVRSRLVPLLVLVVGLAAAFGFGWAEATGSQSGYVYNLFLGGPFATGAAAVLGRHRGLTLKQLFFLVFGCSGFGGIANYSAIELWLRFGAWAPAAGQFAGTIVAVSVAYVAGVLIRRGADARRNEQVADIFR